MKTLAALTFLLSLNAFSADYNCRAGRVTMKLETNTEFMALTIRTIQNSEVLFDGVATEIIEADGLTDLMYETRARNDFRLRFKSSDLKDEVPTMFGFSQGYYGAGFVDSSIKCMKVI